VKNEAGEIERAEHAPADGKARYVLIAPIGVGADTILRYQDQVRQNAEKVAALSGGKLGYLHIRGMDLASTRDFERDLFAAADGKDGLIIDVRDNGGGFTADILLSSLTAPRHARTFARGMDMKTLPQDAYPRDRRLIYGYSRPINVLINFNSFSNAEIFAHAIKTIGRGKLVGTATFGGVISTGAATLIDGTNIRTPFRGWYLPGDVDMERHGAQPDVAVEQTPADEAAGKDPQLEAAVKELMARAANGK
jgi:tricorn protease